MSALLFLGLMRWTHRNWGKAIMATISAPLVVAPLAGVSYLGFGILFKFINAVLGELIPIHVISTIAGMGTLLVLLTLTFLYCRDQRHLSQIVNGPGLGVIPSNSRPSLNARSCLK